MPHKLRNGVRPNGSVVKGEFICVLSCRILSVGVSYYVVLFINHKYLQVLHMGLQIHVVVLYVKKLPQY